jgi:hypothetical protein
VDARTLQLGIQITLRKNPKTKEKEMEENTYTLETINSRQVEEVELLAEKNGMKTKLIGPKNWAWQDWFGHKPWNTGFETRLEMLHDALSAEFEIQYEVHCKPLVPFEELHELDQTEGPPEIYECLRAKNEEEALDDFHDSNAIKVLDDYEITTVKVFRIKLQTPATQ